ncbi:hypothetical protein BH20ACI2_BH20ACI2_05780 [soil metagenome]
MQKPASQIDLSRTWWIFAIFLLVAVAAFWRTNFAPGLGTASFYIHLHATTAALWMVLLISQPLMIRRYWFDWHRRVGQVSYLLVPIVLVSMLLLAHYRIRTVAEENYQLQTFVLYLQFSLAALFALAFTLAMFYRRDSELHARFMVCTGLTLIDPVFARVFFWTHPLSVEYHQWLTYGLTDALFLILIYLDRRNSRARWVFPTMLGIFIIFQLPALFWWTEWPVWQAFARWFSSISLT